MTVRVTTKGQVTIPKHVRDRLGIRPGTKVEFEVAEDGRAYLRPCWHTQTRPKIGMRRDCDPEASPPPMMMKLTRDGA